MAAAIAVVVSPWTRIILGFSVEMMDSMPVRTFAVIMDRVWFGCMMFMS